MVFRALLPIPARGALVALLLGLAACDGGSSGARADVGLEPALDAANLTDSGPASPDAGPAGLDSSLEVDAAEIADSGPMDPDAGSDAPDAGAVPADAGSLVDAGSWPCGIDCSQVQTAVCTKAVCNEGQLLGPLYACIVVPIEDGLVCDDGEFCTVADACLGGACVGGPQNDCGLTVGACEVSTCDETSKSCGAVPGHEGASCTPVDRCRVDGTCQAGSCVGQAKDCSTHALHECNTMACEPATGACVGTPDGSKDGAACSLTGDLCFENKACLAGTCAGGAPKDCWAQAETCLVGECNPATGQCGAAVAPDGKRCNDDDACTSGDQCTAGACGGAQVAGCSHYLAERFETGAAGWTLGGDWQCGTPANVGPPAANSGSGVLGTQLAGAYSPNQGFTTAVADSPPIALVVATSPVASFWAWDHTEGGTSDGWNLQVSSDGGQSFTLVTSVTPPYAISVAGLPAWGGDHAAEGWQRYQADLTAFSGQTVILRLAFHSDGATNLPGVYVDELFVDEPVRIPLDIGTPEALPRTWAGKRFSAALAKTGGTNLSVWSLVAGGLNAGWLSIDPGTGTLAGVPSPSDAGPVRVTVHVEEPQAPANFAEKTFVFEVGKAAYYTSFEGACPAGWTLVGDWQCGVPMNVGPASAFDGLMCVGTNLAGNYSDNQPWAAAISPGIDLVGLASATLSFHAWFDTEGGSYDGFTLESSADGGVTWETVGAVTPAYTLTIAGMPAWGGHKAGEGWQPFEADLSSLVGETVRLRFAFRSDSSGNYPGVYIDDVLVR